MRYHLSKYSSTVCRNLFLKINFYTSEEVIDLITKCDNVYDDDSDDDFNGYISDDEVMKIMGFADENECDSDSNEGEVMENDTEINMDEGQFEIAMDVDSILRPNDDATSSDMNLASTPATSENMTNKLPIYFFDKLVTSNIISSMVEQTNLYAQQYFEEHQDIPDRSRLNYWKKKLHTPSELLQFIAVIIIMGLIHYPKITGPNFGLSIQLLFLTYFLEIASVC